MIMLCSKALWFVGLSYLAVICHCHSGHHDSPQDDQNDDHRESPHPAQISDHRFFLQEIFTKYGHRGQMTFEGFEHLLESLGIGNIIINDHDVSAHKEDAFRNVHDTHDHSKKDSKSHAENDPSHGRTRQTAALHQTTKATTDGKFHSSKQTTYSTVTTPVRNHLNRIESNTIPSVDRTKPEVYLSPQSTQPTKNSTPNSNTAGPESMYHYRLPDAEIPELLVNISSLVDQHQELLHEPQGMVIEQCLSPKEILQTFGINENSSLNPVSFLHLCPAIIYELDQGHCMFQDLSHKKPKTTATWHQCLYALLAVLIISLCGLLSVAVIPIMQKWFYHTLLQFLVGLAVGSLSGDALLHLMPHAMLSGDGGHGGASILLEVAERNAVWRGFTALGGILFFFVAERLLAVISTRKETHQKKSPESEAHYPEVVLYSEGKVGQKLSQYRKNSQVELSDKEVMHMLAHASPKSTSIEVPEIQRGHGHGHSHSHDVPQSITAVAWMVIMGDGLHNFCDGLAIGAAFASGIEGGISTTVAVFCHELPHELGDFAMLLRTGMEPRRALQYNVLSSVLCLAGAVVGLCLGGIHSATGWVFAVTAGIFLYVALVDMLPELSTSSNPDSNPLHQLAIQVLGISTGVSIMLIIANYEQDLQSIVS